MTSPLTRGSLLDDFFKEVAPGFFIKPLHGDPVPSASQIKIDVSENDQAFTVRAEIPGVNKQDIHVSVDGSIVTLSAEIRQHDAEREGEKLLRSERYYGSVSRSFQLPAEVDEAQSKARYENGILLLSLPKKVSNSPQRLTVE
ncbi:MULTISPECIES: Hsp20/alpha crystallin family protein [Brachymonas]|uniref:Hsp20/alpha crystallin family protein n=1 Tax=Brachymonas TaxID=28219 RepID=UPI0016B166F5|nr:Hsp20/alpha crystallin family protein [Brachymonas sp. J145]MEE1654449.1 Hsp20/alpha crystallin family protein [Brachymonas sp. J145]NLX17297.1 Hsp20/alpha crystallin family protein [Ramlibacter sp.]